MRELKLQQPLIITVITVRVSCSIAVFKQFMIRQAIKATENTAESYTHQSKGNCSTVFFKLLFQFIVTPYYLHMTYLMYINLYATCRGR